MNNIDIAAFNKVLAAFHSSCSTQVQSSPPSFEQLLHSTPDLRQSQSLTQEESQPNFCTNDCFKQIFENNKSLKSAIETLKNNSTTNIKNFNYSQLYKDEPKAKDEST
ncbi:MAG: hypothetical protein MHPSP_002745, partial [Paramarteilia canceri]